ncbi:HNH endonuclease signature motif containing protein [Bradyrhizobium sp. CCBAU 51765]|uniref:HNH endonuclease signature motif containing protein n=1 Tax=Bradyrhizobium sp. CCBAU 51765 TaxID=1325102 RepID=UPI0018877553|nr:HNH endonuclease signature motif containing protein [Bradyrhizobium sp. CCBAU 51765]
MSSRYRIYMASEAWLESPARYEALRSADFRCRICNVPSDEVPLQAHHRTYERLGAELPEDLTALCLLCHREVTNFLAARRYALQQPPTIVDVVIQERAPLWDASMAAGSAA